MNDSDLITHDVLLQMGFSGVGEAMMWSYRFGGLYVSGLHPAEPHEGDWVCINPPYQGDWNRGYYDLPQIQTVGQLKLRIQDLGVSIEDSPNCAIFRKLDLEGMGFVKESEQLFVLATKKDFSVVVEVDSQLKGMLGVRSSAGNVIWCKHVYFAICVEKFLAAIDQLPAKGSVR